MCLVSIIIPIYNAENYIKNCIASVLSQSFTRFELLLINDGSTDSSGKICDDYAKTDERIRVIHKKNSGVSDTRNHGLGLAKGKYVFFLDADDYWSNKNILEEFVVFAEDNDIDVLRGEYVEIDSNNEIIKYSSLLAKRKQYERQIVDNVTFLTQIVDNEFFSVLCLFRKDFIGHLQFNNQRVFLEDAEFYLSLFSKVGRFSYIPNQFYAYRKHSDAVSVKYVPQKMKDAFDFSRFCFYQADVSVGSFQYRRFCAKVGIRNFLFDVSVISDSVYQKKEIVQWNKNYKLKELQMSSVVKLFHFSLYKYYKVLLPIPLLIMYYYYRHKLRVIIKGA